MLTANEFYRQRFGCKVYKLSLDGGFTCPNRDGTRGTGGCRFCSGSGSGEFAATGENIRAQLTEAKKWEYQKGQRSLPEIMESITEARYLPFIKTAITVPSWAADLTV